MSTPPLPSPEHRSHAHGHPGDDVALAELLDLDARVLPFTHQIVARVARSLTQQPALVVDLGAGAGAGALELAARFPTAHVIAVDRSPVMTHRLREVFEVADLGPRTLVVHADVDRAWTSPDPVDLVWASAVLHEVPDPHGVLAAVLSALRPGGTLAVVEMDTPPRFLPDDVGLGHPGLEERLHAALATSGGLPAHPRWAEALEAGGFTDVTEEQVALDVSGPAALIQQFAAAYLTRITPALTGRVSAADLTVLAELLAADGPHALATRSDLTVRATRTLWTARRP